MESFVTLSLDDYNKLILDDNNLKAEYKDLQKNYEEESSRAKVLSARKKFLDYVIYLMIQPKPPVPLAEVREFALASVIDTGVGEKDTVFKTSANEDCKITPEDIGYILDVDNNDEIQVRRTIEALMKKYPNILKLDANFEIWHNFGYLCAIKRGTIW